MNPDAAGPTADWLRALFDAFDDAVFVHDAEGNVLEANPAACRRLGYTREELLRLNTRDIDAPEFAAGFQDRLQAQLRAGQFRCEGVHRTKDGRLIPVDINTSSVNLNGAPAVLAVIRDISQRKRIEQALRDSQALYLSLVESLPQNIFRKDRAGRFTFGNRRYCETLRLTPEELLGKTDFDFFPPELAAKYVRDDQHILATGATLDATESHRLPDDRLTYVHVVKTPVRDARGAIVGVQGIFWDVTEQVLAEQAITNSERRYRQLTEATLDGILLLDGQGRVELFNPAAEQMFGHAAADVLGQPADRLFPDEFTELCAGGAPAYLQARADTLGRPHEARAVRRNGEEFPVDVALSVLSGDDPDAPPRFLAAVRDLTERNKMRAVLVQNEKLASIGLLSAGVAHEINNPLAFVANNLVVLERDCQGLLALLALYQQADVPLAQAAPELHAQAQALAEEMDLAYIQGNLGRLLARTRDGIDRVTRIVHSLRGMARTDAPRRQDARLPDLVDSSLEILRGRFKKLGITVEQRHDPNPVVPCVETQISQVVLNLLVNAFQAIEAAGRPDGLVRVRTERQGGAMLLEVADNGVGVSPELLPRLFDPFFTTKDVGEGTGLGLSLSHHIVTAHGGRIAVESAPGQGTCFRVYLPLTERRDRP